jgi:hypothetical protein
MWLRAEEKQELKRRELAYRGSYSELEVRALNAQHPARFIVAVPTAADSVYRELRPEVDELVAPKNALARAVFFNRLGEMRDRSFENQRYRASGLTLVVVAIILWNTVYLSRAIQGLKAHGFVGRRQPA